MRHTPCLHPPVQAAGHGPAGIGSIEQNGRVVVVVDVVVDVVVEGGRQRLRSASRWQSPRTCCVQMCWHRPGHEAGAARQALTHAERSPLQSRAQGFLAPTAGAASVATAATIIHSRTRLRLLRIIVPSGSRAIAPGSAPSTGGEGTALRDAREYEERQLRASPADRRPPR
jgi:hypothetical protein